jgi:DNA-binding Lrp family transcriptional regulator
MVYKKSKDVNGGEAMNELLELLRNNALTKPADIARMLGLSEEEVKNRVAEYEKSGVIRGYQAIINRDRLDLDSVQAVIEVKITPEREGGFNRTAARIARFSEVQSLFLMSGTYDLLVFVQGRNLKEVASFVSERLSTIDGVLSTSTHFMLKTYKESGVLMEAEQPHERLQVSP